MGMQGAQFFMPPPPERRDTAAPIATLANALSVLKQNQLARKQREEEQKRYV